MTAPRSILLTLVVLAGVAGLFLLIQSLLSETTPYGVRDDYVPDHDVLVEVGDLSQSLIDRHPEGTRFALAAGIHRLDEKLRPRTGQQFLGFPGAVLNGSKVLDQFHRDGAVWIAEGQTQRVGEEHGECEETAPACGLAEDVFVDGEPVEQVTDLDELQPGRFFFDYEDDRIYLADDPEGRTVETTVADAAIYGEKPDGGLAADVAVRNLVIEKFGSQAQDGAVDSRDASGWIVENCTVRLNHGAGIYTADGSRVRGNQVVRNGQLGIAGRGDDVIVEDNEIAHNNWAGFSHGWEAGGTKWVKTDGLVVRGNWSHDNHGPGLWTDEGNIRTAYVDNIVEDNYSSGIFHEISYDAVIRDNEVRRNGAGHAEWGYGAGIQISASSNVTVTNNVVEDNARGITLIMQERGDGPHGPREVAGVTVSENTIGPGNGPTGLFSDVGDDAYFAEKGNRFVGNTYRGDVTFEWMDGQVSAEQWREYGNDTDGTFK